MPSCEVLLSSLWWPTMLSGFSTSTVVEYEERSLPVLVPFSFEREMRLFLRLSLSFP